MQQALDAGMPFEQIERMNAQETALMYMANRVQAGDLTVEELTSAESLTEMAKLIDWFSSIPREGMPPPPGFVSEWQGMRFRSKTERRIAEALDRANVAFFPNARGRLGVAPDYRENREPDFLVVSEGKLGILEVDGDAAHPPQNAAADHARDRLFRSHGIKVVERFPATTCYEDPDRVVAEFRRLLALNG